MNKIVSSSSPMYNSAIGSIIGIDVKYGTTIKETEAVKDAFALPNIYGLSYGLSGCYIITGQNPTIAIKE